ncbi:DUF6265 family protein [Zunongwangia sp.]|uniref:DUF6265 family protein n=1 Tax=Zunongwangia sp. TaxID=1965325 RepID=UPI003AA8C08A
MNRILLIVIVLISSCNQNTKSKNVVDEKSSKKYTDTITETNFDWLLGKWKRLNEQEGKETFENWEKKDSTEYRGIGFTLQNGDVIKQEKMMISKTNNNWKLSVKTLEEQESTDFELIKAKQEEFVFVNDSIEFPNEIKYWKKGNRLYATVKNDSINVDFEFKKD